MIKKRSDFWDNYKGILMLLVVFGHFIYSYANTLNGSFAQEIYIIIYSFHMPAFIFCSGYFSKSENSRGAKALTKLMLYYVLFNTVMILISFVTTKRISTVLEPYFSYWYILSLISWRLIADKASRIKGILLFSVLIALLAGYWQEFSNLLSIQRTVVFFGFFIAGYKFDKDKLENFISNRKPFVYVLGVVMALAVLCGMYLLVGRFDFTISMTTMMPYALSKDIIYRIIFFVVAAVMIISMLFAVPKRRIPLLTKIGKNSLLIYLGHRIVTIVFYKIFSAEKCQGNHNLYLIYMGLAVVATIVTCLVLGGNFINKKADSLVSSCADAIVDKSSTKGRVLEILLMSLFVLLLMSEPLVRLLT